MNQRRRLAYRDDRIRARTKRVREVLELPALEPAADDRDDAAVKTLERASRGRDVRRLRVVDEPHALNLRHLLERMFETAEPFNRALHGRRWHTGHASQRRRGQHIAE